MKMGFARSQFGSSSGMIEMQLVHEYKLFMYPAVQHHPDANINKRSRDAKLSSSSSAAPYKAASGRGDYFDHICLKMVWWLQCWIDKERIYDMWNA